MELDKNSKLVKRLKQDFSLSKLRDEDIEQINLVEADNYKKVLAVYTWEGAGRCWNMQAIDNTDKALQEIAESMCMPNRDNFETRIYGSNGNCYDLEAVPSGVTWKLNLIEAEVE